MITKSEYDAYSAHGCADYVDDDREHAAVLLARALESATNTAEHRVVSARLAFETAAHSARLATFRGLDEYARMFAERQVEFYNLRGTLLLTDRSDKEINDECVALLRQQSASEQ